MSLSFTGYAAIWDRMDRAGDVMRRGAFAGAGEVPLLWQHRGTPMGRITALAEDETGLSVAGTVDDPVGGGGGTVGRIPAARRPSGRHPRHPVGRAHRDQPGDGADATARPRDSDFNQGGLIWT